MALHRKVKWKYLDKIGEYPEAVPEKKGVRSKRWKEVASIPSTLTPERYNFEAILSLNDWVSKIKFKSKYEKRTGDCFQEAVLQSAGIRVF